QGLAALSVRTSLLARRSRTGKTIDSKELDQLVDFMDDLIGEVRSFAEALRAPDLAGGGLMEALGKLAEITAKKFPCEFICEKPVAVKDTAAALALFRIAQEAVWTAIQVGYPEKIFIILR